MSMMLVVKSSISSPPSVQQMETILISCKKKKWSQDVFLSKSCSKEKFFDYIELQMLLMYKTGTKTMFGAALISLLSFRLVQRM